MIQDQASYKVYEQCSNELINDTERIGTAESILWIAYLIVSEQLVEERQDENRR